MDERAKLRWYQFTLRRILGAVFWFALCVGLAALSQWCKAPDQKPPLLIGIIATIYLSPFVAVGTLFGHPFRGPAAGVILGGGYVPAVYIALENGWIGFP
jgi:hypothetical protein